MKHTNTIKGKEYKENMVETTRVENLIINNQNSVWFSKGKLSEISKIYASNKDLFTSIFGKHNFIFNGEEKMYTWEITFKERIFLIFSDKSKMGTKYEVILKDGEGDTLKEDVDIILGKICTEFLDEINKILTEN